LRDRSALRLSSARVGDPDRDARGDAAIPAIAVEPIRALARDEDDVGEVEPPAGKAQSLKGLGALPLAERLLERPARGLPVAPRQRLVGGPALAGLGSDMKRDHNSLEAHGST
jgi:hypothetical protein